MTMEDWVLRFLLRTGRARQVDQHTADTWHFARRTDEAVGRTAQLHRTVITKSSRDVRLRVIATRLLKETAS